MQARGAATCCYMNSSRTNPTNCKPAGGKEKKNPSFFCHCCFSSGIAHANRSILCLRKKKKKEKTHKKIIIKRKTLTRDGCKITPMHKDPPPPRHRSLEPVFPYQAWGLRPSFWVLLFSFLRVLSSSLVLVHWALNWRTRGRNNVPFIFIFDFSLEALHGCTLDPANDTCVRTFF